MQEILTLNSANSTGSIIICLFLFFRNMFLCVYFLSNVKMHFYAARKIIISTPRYFPKVEIMFTGIVKIFSPFVVFFLFFSLFIFRSSFGDYIAHIKVTLNLEN